MSHFYGILNGSRGEATRCGTKASGLDVQAGSWNGGGCAHLGHNQHGGDVLSLDVIPWKGTGQAIQCYQGPASGAFDLHVCDDVGYWSKHTFCTVEECKSFLDGLVRRTAVIVPAGCFFEGA